MYEIFLIIFLITSIALVVMIILQQGKNADIGSSFKTGSSNSLFSSSSSANFMTRTTAVLTVLFFSLSLVLGNINNTKIIQESERKEYNNVNKMQTPVK